MTKKWPCPCCGHQTLAEGPGDYDVCGVCFWEDDPSALRWPLTAGGPNGVPLIDAQRTYEDVGACVGEYRDRARRASADEPRDPGWRTLDLDVDDVERSPDDPGGVPWPADAEALYWWRPSYYRLPANRTSVPVPRRPPSTAAERLVSRILEAVPEAGPIDREMRCRFEAPAPLWFCGQLGKLALGAYASGDVELALRTVTAVNTGLTDGDDDAHNCVSVAFLEQEGWADDSLSSAIDDWPREIRREVRRQNAHLARARRRSRVGRRLRRAD
jgi:cysteine-rich CPCC protein